MVRGEQRRIDRIKLPQWKPRLPTDAAEYQPFFQDRDRLGHQNRQAEAAFAWNALEEVVRMAEGRNELSFGKIAAKRTQFGDGDAPN
jgi:hypothetical protein